ncbi:hypothetical protein PGTUg99_029757 [Puccinia graminis f. sp. tritici]|uniref:Uncharacterized protein n=1 Tax=Puccinia graminis f. sp. tritici TaxID=56615 RepID=A0A5B0RHG2_PUCGR|nr:hypothetical protein PGTUg99_029757 [Puccinia graminis f. sp. tritici]
MAWQVIALNCSVSLACQCILRSAYQYGRINILDIAPGSKKHPGPELHNAKIEEVPSPTP